MPMNTPPGGSTLETMYVDIAARADQLVMQADEAVKIVLQRLDALEAKNQELEKSYSKLGGFMRDALAVGTGMIMARIGGNLTNAVMNFGKSLISTNAQMQMYTKSFEVLTGSAEKAAETIDWVKEQAKATPFDVRGLISASQSLMTWGLDLKEWFTIVGDTAAAMNRPLQQVVNAVGTLATGQTGEAVRRFRDLGINLREFTDRLEFDARGALVTPLEEVIPIVKQIMEEKFGGMMASQSKTWQGVLSNMADTWQQFVQVLGEPLFEKLNEALFNVYSWVEQNADAIEGFAETLGNALGGVVDLIFDIVKAFGDVARWIDDIITRLVGTPDWVKQGIQAGKQVVAMGAGSLAATKELVGGLLSGDSLEEAAEKGRVAMLDTMTSIEGGVQSLDEKWANLTEHQLAGIAAVRERWEALFKDVSDAQLMEQIAEGADAQQLQEVWGFMERVGLAAEGTTDAFTEENWALLELNETYSEAVSLSESLATAKAKVAEQEAKIREEQEANLLLAEKLADKFHDKVKGIMESYAAAIEAMRAKTEEEIAKIEQDAAQAEADAITRHQEEVAAMRDAFAREQLRRRQEFNRNWARLLREQNEEVIDAEWEYEYAKRNLLIDGDEIALADLEARYAHEKDVRAREQGEARDDMRTAYADQTVAAQEQFELQIQQLGERLAAEIENIRQTAQENILAKQQELEEKERLEAEALQEKLNKIGEALVKEVEGNTTATGIILNMWQNMYGGITAAAIQAGIDARNELNATVAAALAASAAVTNVMAGYRAGPRTVDYMRPSGRMGRPSPGPRAGYAEGGYVEATESALVHAGEFVSTRDTTQALESALGGTLTQGALQALAVSNRQYRNVHVTIDAPTLGADVVDRLYRDLTDAMWAEARGDY